tara:strand:+ start:540 stop:752 length:213 start_codon:yes stop_codon:yes gene_type:complete
MRDANISTRNLKNAIRATSIEPYKAKQMKQMQQPHAQVNAADFDMRYNTSRNHLGLFPTFQDGVGYNKSM